MDTETKTIFGYPCFIELAGGTIPLPLIIRHATGVVEVDLDELRLRMNPASIAGADEEAIREIFRDELAKKKGKRK